MRECNQVTARVIREPSRGRLGLKDRVCCQKTGFELRQHAVGSEMSLICILIYRLKLSNNTHPSSRNT